MWCTGDDSMFLITSSRCKKLALQTKTNAISLIDIENVCQTGGFYSHNKTRTTDIQANWIFYHRNSMVVIGRCRVRIYALDSDKKSPDFKSIKLPFNIHDVECIMTGIKCFSCHKVARYLLLATSNGVYKYHLDCQKDCATTLQYFDPITHLLDGDSQSFSKVLYCSYGRYMAAVCSEKIVLLDPNTCLEVQNYYHQAEKVHILDGFIIFWDLKYNFWSILDITG